MMQRDVSVALASCERKVHTGTHVQGAGKALQVPCLKVEKDAHFWRFQSRATSFRVAGVALCDIITCRKSFCLTGAILSRGGQKMSCIYGLLGLIAGPC